ncbi:MAG: beta-ketoacyl-[acyl-carrier-protein] synthase family protein [Candidatus Omnitrophota bacterium]|nr:beta-ketoacyl-[acyl-carrier-protein] synthase family protein [Candidatus Omnitrophota bacterium]
MDKTRVVITGVGVVAPNGIGKDEFWSNCFAGVSGIKPITLFDVSRYRCHYAGEVSDFQPEHYLGPKGLRNLDRTTLLALVAAKLAIEDAHLEITDENRNDIGVVLGSTMGSVHSISEFDRTGLREGPRYVNPALFPNAVINSPASQVAIRFGLRGLNSTISTGFSASLDAIGYAMDMLTLGRARTLLVGGVEELCIETFLGFYKLGFLIRSFNGGPIRLMPFHPQCAGTLLGEGAVFCVMETLERAEERGATIYAELLGYGTQFSPALMYHYDPSGEAAAAAMRISLEDAGVTPGEIHRISACANAVKDWDTMEAAAIQAVFGPGAPASISAVKSLLGESFSAGGAFQLAEAVGVLINHAVLAIAHRGHLVPAGHHESIQPGHHSMQSSDPDAHPNLALIDSFGPTGVSSALVIGGAHQAN